MFITFCLDPKNFFRKINENVILFFLPGFALVVEMYPFYFFG